MSCDLISGRGESCKSAVSGLHAVYMINFDDLDVPSNVTYGATNDSDVITAIAGASTNLYKFDLKGNNSLETSIISSRENGTTYFETALAIELKRQDATTTKNVKLMAYGRPRIIVHARGDQWFLLGLDQGCDIESGSISSGSALGDFNGYKLNFKCEEEVMPNFIDCTTEAELVTLMGGSVTVVS